MLQNMVELQFMDSAVTGRARGKKLGRGEKKKKGQPDWNVYAYIFIGGRREKEGAGAEGDSCVLLTYLKHHNGTTKHSAAMLTGKPNFPKDHLRGGRGAP